MTGSCFFALPLPCLARCELGLGVGGGGGWTLLGKGQEENTGLFLERVVAVNDNVIQDSAGHGVDELPVQRGGVQHGGSTVAKHGGIVGSTPCHVPPSGAVVTNTRCAHRQVNGGTRGI